LNRPAEPAQIRQRPLGDQLGHEVELAAPPEPLSDKQSQAAGEAALGFRNERVHAAIFVCIGSLEGGLPAGDPGELAVDVEALVVDVVQPSVGKQIHHIERSIVMAGGRRSLGKCIGCTEQSAGDDDEQNAPARVR
jgi:hypothetical protein